MTKLRVTLELIPVLLFLATFSKLYLCEFLRRHAFNLLVHIGIVKVGESCLNVAVVIDNTKFSPLSLGRKTRSFVFKLFKVFLSFGVKLTAFFLLTVVEANYILVAL